MAISRELLTKNDEISRLKEENKRLLLIIEQKSKNASREVTQLKVGGSFFISLKPT